MKINTTILFVSVLFALSASAQDFEFPLKKIYEHAAVSKAIKGNPLLLKFSEAHASDTVGVEFKAIQGDDGLEWAKHTDVILNGNEGQEGNNEFTSHQLFRIQPFGPEAEDEWEDYIYVVRVRSDGKSASMIIHFKCKFAYPERVEGPSPKLESLEVVADKSVIK